MTDHTDNDGAQITPPRFSADDAERPKFIRDATLDSEELGLEVVGWWPEGDASRYAERIAAMLNQVERLRRDVEPWHWIVQRYGSPPDKGWNIWAGRHHEQCTGRRHIACLGDGDESERLARQLCDAHNAAIAAEREAER